jgi:hypothetical protein
MPKTTGQLPTTSFAPEPDTLLVEDRSLAHGFVQLAKLVLSARNLSRDAKLLYAVLLMYAWQAGRCFPGYRRLCQDMQASENMVRKYMRELEAAKLLSQRRRGLGKTNIYTMLALRTAKIEVLEPHQTEVLDPAKTAGKVDTAEEEQDIHLRNSKVNAPHRDRYKRADAKYAFRKLDQTDSHPASPYRTTSIPRRSHSLERLDSVLARLRPRPAPPRAAPAQSGQAAPSPVIGSEQLAVSVTEISHDLGDIAHLRSNFTQANRLLQRSGLMESFFVSKLYEARAITKDRQRSPSAAAASPVTRPMAYFWRVVRDQLHLGDDIGEATMASDAADGPRRQGRDEGRNNGQLDDNSAD